MRIIRGFISVMAMLSFVACAIDNLEIPSFNNRTDEITIIGRVTRFDDCDVQTRAGKQGDEGKITSFAMAIFKVENNQATDCVHYEYHSNANQPVFAIDRSNDKYDDGARFVIYVFANVENMKNYSTESNLSEMLSEYVGVSSQNIPDKGFPMIGSLGDTFSTNIDQDGQVLILSPSDGGDPKVNNVSKSTLDVPLKALYAKINFEIEVRPDQTIQGNYAPQFEMTGYDIVNVPNSVDFDSNTNADTDGSIGVVNPIKVKATGKASGADKIAFSFYVPENLLVPGTEPDYPFVNLEKDGNTFVDSDGNGIRDEDEILRQRYKCTLVEGQPATNVVIHGTFRDHQNHYYDVDYTIHLGENNYNDFNIKRNTEYNNYITIRGVLNSSDGQGEMSIDHRVNIKRTQPAIISLRREVLLDSHFEIRPLRIKKSAVTDPTVNAVKVEVLNPGAGGKDNDPNTADWMRIERSAGVDTDWEVANIYINDGTSSSGKRKYFTQNLVTGGEQYSLVNSTSVIIPLDDNNKEDCVWIYIDECTEAGDDVRSGTIQVTYGLYNGRTFTATTKSEYPVVKYAINQRMLFPVAYNSNSYNIEYYEEYLYNYDADADFGDVQTEYEGMQWGLDGVQLSFDNQAILISSGGWSSFTEDIYDAVLKYSPYYDFYLKTDIKESDWQFSDNNKYADIVYERKGHTFCNLIIADLKDPERNRKTEVIIDKLALNEQPKSAIEYCYNKNKRNADGTVANVQWYLPAIDEMEEIVMSRYDNNTKYTYARFEDLQAKKYWSCQPAYKNNYLFVDRGAGDRWGEYMIDNTDRARATSVLYEDKSGKGPSDPSNYTQLTSGMTGYFKYIDADYSWSGSLSNTKENDVVGDGRERFQGANGTLWSNTWDHTLTKPLYDDPNNPNDGGALLRSDMARVRCVRKM